MSVDNKGEYIKQIRKNSAYPTYRSVIGLVEFLLYLLAGLSGAAGVLGGVAALANGSVGPGTGLLFGGLASAAILVILTRFYKEAALILADIGDAITEARSQERPNT